MGSKLYVGNLSYDTTSSDLEQLLSQHGTVQSGQVIGVRVAAAGRIRVRCLNGRVEHADRADARIGAGADRSDSQRVRFQPRLDFGEDQFGDRPDLQLARLGQREPGGVDVVLDGPTAAWAKQRSARADAR